MDNSPLEKKTVRALVAILVGLMTIILAVLLSIVFEFTLVGNLVTSWILTTAYALFAFFLIDPKTIYNPVRFVDREVIQEVIREIPVETIREVERLVPIQIPMENKTIEVVDRPVIQEIIREIPVEVEKEVIRYRERKHKTLNIPHFKFIGSIQTKTFHRRTCKFSKMLKNKYKLHSNTKVLFKRKHFKACKSCMKKK